MQRNPKRAPFRAMPGLVGLLLAAALAPGGAAQEPPSAPADREELEAIDPLDSGLEERVGVRLVIVDTLVLDRDGRTVGDLTLDDFEVAVDGKPTPVDTLDVACPEGGVEDARGVNRADRRGAPAVVDGGRKIVIALDYQHLRRIERMVVLEQAREALKSGMAPGDEIMVAALVGGLRVEQPFTTDAQRVLETLERMEYDISLWQPDFAHLTEQGFLGGMESLLDLLEAVDGHKAMVLYSSMWSTGGLASRYEALAAAATSARCSIYPVHAVGLENPVFRTPPPPG